MKQRKNLALLLATAILVLALVGCGGKKPGNDSSASSQGAASSHLEPVTADTAEGLAQQLAAAAKGRQMTQVISDLEMELVMTSSGTSTPVKVNFTMEMTQSANPYAVCRIMENSAEMGTQISTEHTQFYTRMEDGVLVNYTHTNNDDQWMREELPAPETVPDGYAWLTDKEAEDLSMQGPQPLEDQDVYVLSLTLNGEELQQLLRGMGGMKDALVESGITELDASGLSASALFYVDAQTSLPTQMDLEIKGSDAVMDALLTGMLGSADGTSVNTLRVVYSSIGYAPVEVTDVPSEGVYRTVQGDADPKQDDGSYVIQESGSAVKFTGLSNWTVSDSAYNGLYLERNDGKQIASMVMYANVTTQEFINYINQEDIAAMKGQMIYDSHGNGDKIGNFTTMWVKGTGLNLYYAWTPVGDNWLFVQLADYASQSLEDAMTPLLNAVKDHQL